MNDIESHDNDRTANLLGAAALAIGDRMNEKIRSLGLSMEEASVLTTLSSTKLRIRDLADILHHSHSGTVRLISRLEEKGLLEKLPGADRREMSVELTKKGREVLRAVHEARSAFLNGVVDGVEPSFRGTLASILEAILRSFADDDLETFRICRLCDEGVCDQEICPVEQCYRGSWP